MTPFVSSWARGWRVIASHDSKELAQPADKRKLALLYCAPSDIISKYFQLLFWDGEIFALLRWIRCITAYSVHKIPH